MCDTGAAAIGEALTKNHELETLVLQSNNVGAAGARGIGLGLETNTGLQSLLLANNSVGDAGAQSIALALEKNFSLTRLDVEHNRLSALSEDTLEGMLDEDEIFARYEAIEALAAEKTKAQELENVLA